MATKHLLHTRGYLNHPPLPILMRHTIAIPDGILPSAILPDLLGANILELEVPASTGDSALRTRLPLGLIPLSGLGCSARRVVHLALLLLALFAAEALDLPLLEIHQHRQRDAFVGGEELVVEDFGGVFACEVAGF